MTRLEKTAVVDRVGCLLLKTPLLTRLLVLDVSINSGIPAGKISTYGGVAKALNSSARAVGGALRVSSPPPPVFP